MDRISIDGVDVTLSGWISKLVAGAGKIAHTSSWLSNMQYPIKGPAPTTCYTSVSLHLLLQGGQTCSICKDVAFLCIHHEPGSFARDGAVGIKGARLAEMDGDDVLDHSFYGLLPLGSVVDCAGNVRRLHVFDAGI